MCGNGTHSGERIIHYHEDKLLRAEVPCLCALLWGEEETLCLISTYKRQYEDPAGSRAEASGSRRSDMRGSRAEIHLNQFARFCSTSFESFLAAVPSSVNCFVIW